MSLSAESRTGTPTNWDARINLAKSILAWRPPCGLTALLAIKAMQGYSIDALRSFERGYREDGAA